MCGHGHTCMDGQTCTELLYGQWTVIYAICDCPFRRMRTFHIVTGTLQTKSDNDNDNDNEFFLFNIIISYTN